MKNKQYLILGLMLLCFFGFEAAAQMENRVSPMANETAKINEATVSITYSQPSKKGREIFGGLVPYGKVWRTGANEATVFKTDTDLMLAGKKLPAGQYALFTIPGKNEWTIILNRQHKQWGAYNYDAEKDQMRFTAPAQKNEETVETFTISISEAGSVSLMWDKTIVRFDIAPAS